MTEDLEEALGTIDDLREDLGFAEREVEELKATVSSLEEEIKTYEALADENLEFDTVAPTIECIEMDRTYVEGEFQLGVISGQARDVFMEHTDKYLKILRG